MGAPTTIIHQCCGCSCNVCEDGHKSGNHTEECWERLMEEAKYVTVAKLKTNQ